MSDYTFMVEGDGRNVTYNCETVQLQEVLEHFQDFLRGAGFYFDGNLEFVKDEPVDIEHSKHYYDTNRT